MFKIGDTVKFKKSSLESGMIDATEEDVFIVGYVYPGALTGVLLNGKCEVYHPNHLEHVKEKETMVNTDIMFVDKYTPTIGGKGLYSHYTREMLHSTKPVLEQNLLEERSPVLWEVGQEVFCVRLGKGVVSQIKDCHHYPILVEFEDHRVQYTLYGEYIEGDKNRSLFFSEPKIIADKFPPKKAFVPSLKKGDKVVAESNESKQSFVLEVFEETEDAVSESYTFCLQKDAFKFYKFGEEIKFS